jgi:predicted dithiol-disulfide oxidoreductase (DUF899 family)
MTKHRTGTRKDGIVVHLEHHDVAFATVSRAPLAKLQTYKRRMGWRFPWASSLGSDFNLDFNTTSTTGANSCTEAEGSRWQGA